jgi:predicted ATPase/DNA-binding winged helix-turn-helix (wHTH) protein
MATKHLLFGTFRFDEGNECLWQGAEAIPLRPKPFAVLKYLLAREGALVTKKQLLDDIWPETHVSDSVLKDCIRQLRQALGDDAQSPQFIETAHRRGYRFIAPVAEGKERPAKAVAQTHPPSLPAPAKVLGREQALTQLHRYFEEALADHTKVVFVTGEAGIGKTTLVTAFLEQIGSNACILRGQCLEQYGYGEAYLPILDALSGLAVESDSRILDILRNNTLGASRERMLREIAEALELMAIRTPVVLFLEDLHWSDYSTLDLVSYLARWRRSARLLLIGTYRPTELIVSKHPLRGVKQELLLHKLCDELPVEYLTVESVSEFLEITFPGHRFPATLSAMIHRRTEGNPLFMVNVVEFLVQEKMIVEQERRWQLQVGLDVIELAVPESIREMVDKHIDHLQPAEQRILEGASVVGMDCSAVAISAGLAEDVILIEEICDGLARKHQFLWPAYLAELPDGTITPRYRFIHALYLDVLYKRVAPTRRRLIHGRIGERGEIIYAERVGEIAAELAVHFEQSQDAMRAVKYFLLAAENAVSRSADHEATTLARRGLALLKSLPHSTDRDNQERRLRSIALKSKPARPSLN